MLINQPKQYIFQHKRSIAGVLNSSPRDPLLCILCMSPLFNTPDSDPQLVDSIDSNCRAVGREDWS